MSTSIDNIRKYFQSLSSLDRPIPLPFIQTAEDYEMSEFEEAIIESAKIGTPIIGYLRIMNFANIEVPQFMARKNMYSFLEFAIQACIRRELMDSDKFTYLGNGECLITFSPLNIQRAEDSLSKAVSSLRSSIFSKSKNIEVSLDYYCQEVTIDPYHPAVAADILDYLKTWAPSLELREWDKVADLLSRSSSNFTPFWGSENSRTGINILASDHSLPIQHRLENAESPEEIATLSSNIDRDSAARAVSNIQYYGMNSTRPIFMFQVHYNTLVNGDARHLMKTILLNLEALRQNSIIEVVDIPNNKAEVEKFRHSDLGLVIFGCGIKTVVRINPKNYTAVSPLHPFVYGYSIEIPRGIRSDQGARYLKPIQAVCGDEKVSFVHGVDSVLAAHMCIAANINWMSGTAILPRTHTPKADTIINNVAFRMSNVA